VAIYGWHKLDGKPIQPLYTGHVDWYVDYSHGIRLVSRTIYIDNKNTITQKSSKMKPGEKCSQTNQPANSPDTPIIKP